MGVSAFDSGSAKIRKQMIPFLEKIGSVLLGTPDDIIVAGHTDNVPLKGGPYKSNLGLSIARAASVAEYLLNICSVDPERLSTMGFGEYRPLKPNDTLEGRRKNRRVEIILKTPSKKRKFGSAIEPKGEEGLD